MLESGRDDAGLHHHSRGVAHRQNYVLDAVNVASRSHNDLATFGALVSLVNFNFFWQRQQYAPSAVHRGRRGHDAQHGCW